MKRLGNLYKDIYDLDNIEKAYKEVCKNTRNERKVFNMKQYKAIYISRIYNTLVNREYKVGPYNKFIIYEPKERQIVSQGIQDKVINHLVARYILYPAILPCLIETNVASRKYKGTKAGIQYQQEFIRKCNVKYNGKRKTGKSVPPWDTFFDVSKTREFWVVFSKYGEYNGKKPGCGIQNQINSGRKY